MPYNVHPLVRLPEHTSFSSNATSAARLVRTFIGPFVVRSTRLWLRSNSVSWHRQRSVLRPYSGLAKLFRTLKSSIGFTRFRETYRGFAPTRPACIPPCNPKVTRMLPEPSSAQSALVPPELQMIEPDLSIKIRYCNMKEFFQNVSGGI